MNVKDTRTHVEITIPHTFPDIYTNAFFRLFGWKAAIYMNGSSTITTNASGSTEVTSSELPILERLQSPSEPDDEEGFLNSLLGDEEFPNGYTTYPLNVASREPKQNNTQKDVQKERTFIETLQHYVSQFVVSPFKRTSTVGTVDSILVKIPIHHKRVDIKDRETVLLEQLFKVETPSIYCFSGTSVTFDDLLDIHSDLLAQLKYIDARGYKVNRIDASHVYRIMGRYVLLMNNENITRKDEFDRPTNLELKKLIKDLVVLYVKDDEKKGNFI